MKTLKFVEVGSTGVYIGPDLSSNEFVPASVARGLVEALKHIAACEPSQCVRMANFDQDPVFEWNWRIKANAAIAAAEVE